jgi:hypothetical protein
MTDRGVFEQCFDQPAYSSFIIDLTTRLVQQYRAASFRDLGMPIEDCLWAIANSQRQSDEFVDFCNRFGSAIEEFILGVDSSDFSNVVLPIKEENRENPGIPALRTIIAKALVRRCRDDNLREVASMIGASTGTIGMAALKDFMGEIRSLDDFLFQASLGFYITWDSLALGNSEYYIGEVARVEEATRSRVQKE